ncbi:unnamed protein product [Lupinus luteus]|uniref:Pre-mRNA-splicing factor SLU7 n=1 Tax=Lupinus luteus TaxID=3873 RepID=A0AAV1X9V3_LUPLU
MCSIQLLGSGCPRHHPCAPLVEWIRNLTRMFDMIIFSHVFREANNVADEFATHKLSLRSRSIKCHLNPGRTITNILSWRKLVKKWKSNRNYTKSWYDKGAKIFKAEKYRKGACENCGAMTHDGNSCMDRPRKVGAKWTNKHVALDEKIETSELDYDDKWDRWNGYDASTYAVNDILLAHSCPPSLTWFSLRIRKNDYKASGLTKESAWKNN